MYKLCETGKPLIPYLHADKFARINPRVICELDNNYEYIEFYDELDIPKNGEFVPQKDNCDVVIGWMPIEELQKVTIKRLFLVDKLTTFKRPF